MALQSQMKGAGFHNLGGFRASSAVHFTQHLKAVFHQHHLPDPQKPV